MTNNKKELSRIPVVILNGFLGAGKTTLFRSLLNQASKKNIEVKAIVNDMSELDVDGELIASTDLIEDNKHIFESIPSCVLSSNEGLKQLDNALDNVCSITHPDLVIIETSGSCHPMPLIQYFQKSECFKLTGLLVLVDSLMLKHDYDYGERLVPLMQQNLLSETRNTVNLLVEQVMFCSHLILTKSDRINQDKLSNIANHLKRINPYVSIFSVMFGRIDISELLKMPEYDYYRVEKLFNELQPIINLESSVERPYDLSSLVIKDDRPFHPQRLWEVCHKYLDKRIYRSKGFFWLSSRNDVSLLWNQAAGSIDLELIGYWRASILEDHDNGLLDDELDLIREQIANESGRFGDRKCNLTVIGDKTQVSNFVNALESCFLTEDEIEFWKMGGQFNDPWPKNIVKLS